MLGTFPGGQLEGGRMGSGLPVDSVWGGVHWRQKDWHKAVHFICFITLEYHYHKKIVWPDYSLEDFRY